MEIIKNNVVLLKGNCLELMKDIPDESIDLVVTDCPYHIVSGGCTTGAYGNKKGCGKCSAKWETQGQLYNFENIKSGKLFDNNDIEFKQWLPELFRILKKDTHCYIMINARNLKELQQEAENVGFKFQNILVWRKNNATPNRYYLNNCEFILMLRKGKARNINNMGTKNVLDIPNIIGKKKHPTEKPVELMKILIENSSNKNDVVIDPFMGVGATGIACKELNRKFIGIELDERYFNVAKERIEKVGGD